MKKWMVVLAVLAAGTMLQAQVAEISISGGQSRLTNNTLASVQVGQTAADVANVNLGDGFRLAFRLTLNNYRFFGHEIGYAYNRTQLRIETQPAAEYGMAIHQGFYNFLVYATPEGTRVRPFVTGGGHFNNFVPPGASVTEGSGVTKFGLNYGGGIKARVSSMFGVRFDVRQYLTGKPDFFATPQGPKGKLKQLEVAAGIAFML